MTHSLLNLCETERKEKKENKEHRKSIHTLNEVEEEKLQQLCVAVLSFYTVSKKFFHIIVRKNCCSRSIDQMIFKALFHFNKLKVISHVLDR